MTGVSNLAVMGVEYFSAARIADGKVWGVGGMGSVSQTLAVPGVVSISEANYFGLPFGDETLPNMARLRVKVATQSPDPGAPTANAGPLVAQILICTNIVPGTFALMPAMRNLSDWTLASIAVSLDDAAPAFGVYADKVVVNAFGEAELDIKLPPDPTGSWLCVITQVYSQGVVMPVGIYVANTAISLLIDNMK